ncbi:MAG: ArnT family glycosyltransferase [Phycisphaerae bacterium]
MHPEQDTQHDVPPRRAENGVRIAVFGIMVLFTLLSTLGITWGIPTAQEDHFLWSAEKSWTGEQLVALTNASERFSSTRGADVDVNALEASEEPIELTGNDTDIAAIYVRYRLYTHQPDEMITMQALSGMRPGALQLDPRLYQYGGLFIYPIGALLKIGSMIGLIELTSNLETYLDAPDSFGRFFVVSRAYAASWGIIGVLVVWGIARQLTRQRPAFPILASLLYTIMPVTICMAHEGKPHLPGAVLMLTAIYFAMRSVRQDASPSLRFRNFLILGAACGAAQGMVLSSLPIFILIPLVALFMTRRVGDSGTIQRSPILSWLFMCLTGTAVGAGVYLVTNPYVPYNYFFNPDVISSNFGNSLAMYKIDRIADGFVRVMDLTIEGASWPIVLGGLIGVAWLARRARHGSIEMPPLVCLTLPAALFFLQFVLIGASKPAEYGRFGIFQNTVLAIGAAYALSSFIGYRPLAGWMVTAVTTLLAASFGWVYLDGLRADADGRGARSEAAAYLANLDADRPLLVVADPAPYCLPPLDFTVRPVLKVPYQQPIPASTWARIPQAIGVIPSDAPMTGELMTALNEQQDKPIDVRIFPAKWRQQASQQKPPWLRRMVAGWLPARISWANKPIVVTGVGLPPIQEARGSD